MAVEEIARLCGHSSTTVTETVYPHQFQPVMQSGAEVMPKFSDAGRTSQHRPGSEHPNCVGSVGDGEYSERATSTGRKQMTGEDRGLASLICA